jgi:hypothetical protein
MQVLFLLLFLFLSLILFLCVHHLKLSDMFHIFLSFFIHLSELKFSTVKPVHNDHPRDLKKVGVWQRCLIKLRFTLVVDDSIWLLLTGGRCSQVVVKSGLTIHWYSAMFFLHFLSYSRSCLILFCVPNKASLNVITMCNLIANDNTCKRGSLGDLNFWRYPRPRPYLCDISRLSKDIGTRCLPYYLISLGNNQLLKIHLLENQLFSLILK